MKKLFLFNILACLFALQGLAQDFTYQDENGAWGCRVVYNNEVSIISASGYGTEVVIPDVVKNGENEYSVRQLGEELFIRNKEITKVTLPKGLEILGSRVFEYCENLSVVENSACVTTVYDQAFYNCSSLTHVDLPSCTTIGDASFQYCTNLSSIDGLSKCRNVEKSAFAYCSSLKSIALPSCGFIREHAFFCCPNIRVSLGAFCPDLEDNVFDATATLIVPLSAAAAYKYSPDWYGSSRYTDWKKYFNQITFENDIIEISTKALSDKSGIESVIGATEVSKVTGLKVTGTINSYDIFILRTKMYDLHYLDLSDADIVACDFPYYESCHTSDNEVGANAFRGLKNLISLKLPKNAKVIGDYAVFGCPNLCEVILPEKLEGIGTHSFMECKKLVSIPFPPHLRGIGGFAFYWCESLKNVSFPHNLQSIDDHAFDLCRSLTEVRFPSSIQSVGYNAFVDCPIKKVYTYTIEPIKISQDAFDTDTYSTAELWMPTQSYSNYYYNTQWGQFRNDKYHWFDEPYEYFYVNNDYTLDKGNSADGDKGRFDGTPDVDVNPGGGLIVEGEGDQGAGDVHLKGDGKNWASIIAHANMDAKRLYIDITVKANCWHFFCFPFDVKRSNISCKGSFVFRYYDGKVRADNGKGGWTNLPDTEEYLRAGKGYIFQTSMDATLSILIEKDKFGKLPGVTVSGSLEANASTNEQDASWNFVGNPFTSFFNVDENGFAAPITRWNGSTYEAVRPGDDDITLHPFEAFFVQCPADNDKIEFDAANRTTQIKSEKQAEVNKQKRRQSTLNPNRLMVNLTLGNGNDSDNTRVVFNPEKTARYEMECDAAKFESGTAAVQLYSIEAKAGKMAINERQAGSVRLGYTASKGGTYTISAMRMDQPVLLRDNVMNVTYDLSNGDYQFTSEAGTFDDRFMIMIDGSATGVADIARESGVNILPMQGGMNITGTEGQTVNVYALSGAIVATRTSDGFLSLTKGVYVVEVGQMKAKVAVK